MLILKNNLLSIDKLFIQSADSIIVLNTDVLNSEYLGILTLTNNTTKTIQFVRFENIFKARLCICEEDLEHLQGSTIKLISISSSFTKESNAVKIDFDINKIKLNIKQKSSKELIELRKDLIKMQSQLEALSLGKLVPTVNIANKDYIKPGMILVAIDNGNFMAAYPFADVIKEVNGQQAIDGVVEIDASMIKYNIERTIAEQLDIIGQGVLKQNEVIKTLSEQVVTLSKRVADIDIELATHLDNGII